jgi:hypothetical protein
VCGLSGSRGVCESSGDVVGGVAEIRGAGLRSPPVRSAVHLLSACLRVCCIVLRALRYVVSIWRPKTAANRYNIPANRPQAGSAWSKSIQYTRKARQGRPRAGNRPSDGCFMSMMRPGEREAIACGRFASTSWTNPAQAGAAPHWPCSHSPKPDGFRAGGCRAPSIRQARHPCTRKTSENGEPWHAGTHYGPPTSQRMVLNRKYVRQAHISAQSHITENVGNPPFHGNRCAIGSSQVSHISH